MTCYSNDISVAIDILDNFKDTTFELPDYPVSDSDLLYLIRKREAVDNLAGYILDNAYAAPIVTLIENFIYENKVNAAQCRRDSEIYYMFRINIETAEEAAVYFQ